MFNQLYYDNSQFQGFAVLQTEDNEFVPLLSTTLTGKVVGNIARLIQTHVFKNKGNKAINVSYKFPLNGDAAINKVIVAFNGKQIIADLKLKEEAKKTFDMAKKKGNQAALYERVSPDIFGLQIANLQANSTIEITTEFVQLVKPEAGTLTLRHPLTVVPRFVRDDERFSHASEGQPNLVLVDPGHRFNMSIEFVGVDRLKIFCDNFLTTHERTKNGVIIKATDILPNTDLIIKYTLPQFMTYIWSEPNSTEKYFVTLLTPPENLKVRLKRNTVLLVDSSFSMNGVKWNSAKWATKKALSLLDEEDYFSLCSFSSNHVWFNKEPVKATVQNVKSACKFIDDNFLAGGTELGIALEDALSKKLSQDGYANTLTLITDAEVNDEARILAMVSRETENDGRRINVVCIDSSPNEYLASQIADRGRGIARFLTSNSNERDITSVLVDIVTEISTPVLNGATLQILSTDKVSIIGGYVRRSTRKEMTVDVGYIAREPKWIAGRINGNVTPIITIDGVDGKSTLSEIVDGDECIKQLVGAQLINIAERWNTFNLQTDHSMENDLLKAFLPIKFGKLIDGKNRKIYFENEDNDNTGKEIIRFFSKKFHLMSSEMSFVAVDTTNGKKANKDIIVANALADGWDNNFESSQSMKSLGAVSRSAPMASLSFGGLELFSTNSFDANDVSPAPMTREFTFSKKASKQSSDSVGAYGISQKSSFLFHETIELNKKFDSVQKVDLKTVSALMITSEWTLNETVFVVLKVNGVETARVSLKDLYMVGDRPLNIKLSNSESLTVSFETDSDNAFKFDVDLTFVA